MSVLVPFLYPCQVCDSPGLQWVAYLYPQHTVYLLRVGNQIWLNRYISADSQVVPKHHSMYNRCGCATLVLPYPAYTYTQLLTVGKCTVGHSRNCQNICSR